MLEKHKDSYRFPLKILGQFGPPKIFTTKTAHVVLRKIFFATKLPSQDALVGLNGGFFRSESKGRYLLNTWNPQATCCEDVNLEIEPF